MFHVLKFSEVLIFVACLQKIWKVKKLHSVMQIQITEEHLQNGLNTFNVEKWIIK